jgi:2-polyprenyl-3-methyl-5-hydroxy-6-metoxy-1,4-benzoquinol methylase
MNTSENFWDRMAPNYDREEKKDKGIYMKIVEKLKKYLKKSDIVLDYGCGTGLVANEIAATVKAVYAIDMSSKMIEIAIEKADARKITNIDYVQSTLFDERYKKGSFDAVLVFYVLHLLEDLPRAIQRIHELLKPGGLIISTTPCMGEKPFLGILFSLVSKIGLIPKISHLKISGLEDLLVNNKFEIIEKECLHQSTQQYFIAGKKICRE